MVHLELVGECVRLVARLRHQRRDPRVERRTVDAAAAAAAGGEDVAAAAAVVERAELGGVVEGLEHIVEPKKLCLIVLSSLINRVRIKM